MRNEIANYELQINDIKIDEKDNMKMLLSMKVTSAAHQLLQSVL